MRIEDDTVVFKSVEGYFEKEKDGRKPNTVRILSEYEAGIIYNMWDAKRLSRIRIELRDQDKIDSFERELTDVTWAGSFLGYYIVVFSWRHKDE